jgi:phosphoglycerate dehydrogenase-like enzyme
MHYGYSYTKEEVEKRQVGTVVQCDRDNVAREIVDADVIVPLMCRMTKELIDRAGRAKLIIQYGAGVEGIDIEYATAKGIYVSNIASRDTGNAESCAEMVVFLLLGCLRRVNQLQCAFRERRLGVPIGDMLKGKSVCIVGFGNIAKALVPRLVPFGVEMFALRRHVGKFHETDMGILKDVGEIGREEDMRRILGKSNVIVFTCSLNPSSQGMMNREFLSMCAMPVIIVNVARGGLLDYDTVVEGLASEKIRALGIDVQFDEPFDPDDPVARHDAVYCTPHVAGVTQTSYRNMARIVADEAEKVVLRGQEPSVVVLHQ